MNRHHVLDGIGGIHFAITHGKFVYLLPQRLAIRRILHRGRHRYAGKLRTSVLYFFGYYYFHIECEDTIYFLNYENFDLTLQ